MMHCCLHGPYRCARCLSAARARAARGRVLHCASHELRQLSDVDRRPEFLQPLHVRHDLRAFGGGRHLCVPPRVSHERLRLGGLHLPITASFRDDHRVRCVHLLPLCVVVRVRAPPAATPARAPPRRHQARRGLRSVLQPRAWSQERVRVDGFVCFAVSLSQVVPEQSFPVRRRHLPGVAVLSLPQLLACPCVVCGVFGPEVHVLRDELNLWVVRPQQFVHVHCLFEQCRSAVCHALALAVCAREALARRAPRHYVDCSVLGDELLYVCCCDLR